MTDNLKIATVEDIPYIYEILEEFFNQTNFNSLEMDPPKVHDFVSDMILNKENNVIILSVDEDNIPMGIICATIQEHLFSRDRGAFELVWYVKKDHRKSRTGITLLNALEFWARKTECRFLQLGSAQGIEEQELVERLYERKGFVPVEKNFIKVF